MKKIIEETGYVAICVVPGKYKGTALYKTSSRYGVHYARTDIDHCDICLTKDSAEDLIWHYLYMKYDSLEKGTWKDHRHEFEIRQVSRTTTISTKLIKKENK